MFNPNLSRSLKQLKLYNIIQFYELKLTPNLKKMFDLKVIRKKKEGGYAVFCLMDNDEPVKCSAKIQELAETLVEDYSEVAKEIVDALNQHRPNPEGGTMILELENEPREKFLNAVQNLYVDEYSAVEEY